MSSSPHLSFFVSATCYCIAKFAKWLNDYNKRDYISDMPHLSPEQLLKADLTDPKYKDGVVVSGRVVTVDLNRLYFFRNNNIILNLGNMNSNTRCQITCEDLNERKIMNFRSGFVDRYNLLLEGLLDNNATRSYLKRRYIFNDDMLTVQGSMMRNKVTGENYVLAKLLSQGNPNTLNHRYKTNYDGLEQLERYSRLVTVYSLVGVLLSELFGTVKSIIKPRRSESTEPKASKCAKCRVNSINVVYLDCKHFSLCSGCYKDNLVCNICETENSRVLITS